MVDGLEAMKLSQALVLGLPDFELIRVIGRGSYAKVLLVRLKKNEQVYAMKVVKKELVHDDEVRTEREDIDFISIYWNLSAEEAVNGLELLFGGHQ